MIRFIPEWIGKTVGKVRIEKELARGGMAEVYLGMHLTLDRPVPVKVMHHHVEADPDLKSRFEREAKVVAGLRHPNIVQIFDFDTADGHPYIVMEYLRGSSLATYLRELHKRNQRLQPAQVARLLSTIATALDYAHERGVVHRDIKPGNIILHTTTNDISIDQPITDEIGFIQGLDTDTQLLTESAEQMLTAFEAGNEAELLSQVEKMLNVIVGNKSDDYGDWNAAGAIEDPGDGYGLLVNEDQLGYIQGTFTNGDLARTSTDATPNMLTHGDHVKISATNVSDWTAQLRTQLMDIVQNPTNPEREGLVRQTVTLANQIRIGIDLDGNERVEPIPGEGGAQIAYEHAYYMADMLILPAGDQASTP